MHNQWFYGRGSEITGPVSGQELFDLAKGGTIILSDTIWQDGNEEGSRASLVKNLFPEAVIPATVIADAVPAITLEAPLPVAVPGNELVLTLPVTAPATYVEKPFDAMYIPPQVTKKARAVAGKGAVLVGQDGKTVKFRMVCSTCKHEDSSWKTLAIPRGTYRTGFYCPKCRKKRDAEITGYH